MNEPIKIWEFSKWTFQMKYWCWATNLKQINLLGNLIKSLITEDKNQSLNLELIRLKYSDAVQCWMHIN